MVKPDKDKAATIGKVSASGSSQGKRGSDPAFGVEGTNKTLPEPQDDAQPLAELQGTKSKYVPETPYTRG